jgi:hypothetical protein
MAGKHFASSDRHRGVVGQVNKSTVFEDAQNFTFGNLPHALQFGDGVSASANFVVVTIDDDLYELVFVFGWAAYKFISAVDRHTFLIPKVMEFAVVLSSQDVLSGDARQLFQMLHRDRSLCDLEGFAIDGDWDVTMVPAKIRGAFGAMFQCRRFSCHDCFVLTRFHLADLAGSSAVAGNVVHFREPVKRFVSFDESALGTYIY